MNGLETLESLDLLSGHMVPDLMNWLECTYQLAAAGE